jgi:CheY-like chemotaxis protein
VLTDLEMPVMDGVTLCRTLRKLSPQTPIVVWTGATMGEASTEMHKVLHDLGIHHILHKPHDATALLDAIAELLHASKSP